MQKLKLIKRVNKGNYKQQLDELWKLKQQTLKENMKQLHPCFKQLHTSSYFDSK